MSASSNHGAAMRRPVVYGGKKIPNLSVRTLDNGTDVYEVRMRMPDGSHPRIKLDATTAGEAVRERNGLLVDRDRGVAHENRLMNPTMAELLDEYFADCQARVGITDERRRFAASTISVYRSQARNHIVPFMGRKRVADVTTADLRRFVAHMQAKEFQGRKFSPAAVKNTLKVTTGALTFAHKSGYVDRNVARDLSRDDRPSGGRLTEPRYLTKDEVAHLLATASDKWRPIWACCVYAALRISEALGLQWECVDFKNDTITVRQQVDRLGKGIVPVKTASSAATLPMVPALKRELLAHRARLAEQNLQRVAPKALLIVGTGGQLVAAPIAAEAFRTAANRAGLNRPGLPPLGQHDLRHTAAAHALQSGANPAEVAEFLRHANPAVTMSTYAGLTADGRGGAVRKLLDAGFGG